MKLKKRGKQLIDGIWGDWERDISNWDRGWRSLQILDMGSFCSDIFSMLLWGGDIRKLDTNFFLNYINLKWKFISWLFDIFSWLPFIPVVKKRKNIGKTCATDLNLYTVCDTRTQLAPLLRGRWSERHEVEGWQFPVAKLSAPPRGVRHQQR